MVFIESYTTSVRSPITIVKSLEKYGLGEINDSTRAVVVHLKYLENFSKENKNRFKTEDLETLQTLWTSAYPFFNSGLVRFGLYQPITEAHTVSDTISILSEQLRVVKCLDVMNESITRTLTGDIERKRKDLKSEAEYRQTQKKRKCEENI